MRPLDPTRIARLCAHAGLGHGDGQPLVTPIVQSTTFCRDGIGSTATHQYSRVSNPTVAALEIALGRLEDAPPAVAFTTGLAAETALFLTLLDQGDHVVCSSAAYGGTTRLFEQVLSRYGITASFVDSSDLDAVRAALRPETRLVFIETPANPTLGVTDIAAVAGIAHAHGVPLAVDNTFLTAALQQPLDLGADVVVTSTTKFVDGHSAALGGAVTSRDEELLERLRFVRKSTGAIQTPLDAFLTLQGLKTLSIRLERQSATATALAAWLADHPRVARVHHPSLLTGEARRIAEAQHLAHGAVLSFEVEGGLDGAVAVAGAVTVCRLVEHVGSVETLLTHAATMTHAGVAPEARRAAGIGDGLLRLSVGLEPEADIRADLGQALACVEVPCTAA